MTVQVISATISVQASLRDLWRRRELLVFFAWRELVVRYRQTFLGIAWAVVQPVAIALALTLFLHRLAGVGADGVPYLLFALSGLIPWQLIAYSLTHASNCLVENERLITKVAFPRLILPLASLAAGLMDAVIGLLIVLIVALVFGRLPGAEILLAPVFLALAALAALAVSLWLAPINARYRDVRYTLPFLIQFWLVASPVAYPGALVPESWRALYYANPVAGAIEGFRWALNAGPAPDGTALVGSLITTGLLLVGGVYFFLRRERSFADVL